MTLTDSVGIVDGKNVIITKNDAGVVISTISQDQLNAQVTNYTKQIADLNSKIADVQTKIDAANTKLAKFPA